MGKKEKKKNVPDQRNKNVHGKKSEPVYNKILPAKFKSIQLIPPASALAAGIYFIYSSYKSNGYFGFPLDDPWIHLTFAKNLVSYGSFSYFKNEIVTSGSTSPLYTLLAALLYLFFKNEFLISYFIGITFGVLLVHITARLFQKIVPGEESAGSLNLLPLAAGLLAALGPKLNLINVSGMETSMFIFFIAASLYAYQTGRMIMLGIFLGLTLWCRPDGLVLWAAIICGFFMQKYLYPQKILKRTGQTPDEKTKKIITAFSIALLFMGAYFLFNYLLSGSMLPNTFSAKLEYYQNNDRASFLENEVIKYFTQSEFSLFWIPFLAGLLAIFKSLFKRERNDLFVLLLFIIGLIGVYYIKLPFAHRFGRYLMPVIPFYIIIAVYGLKIFLDFLLSKFKSAAVPNFLFVLYLTAAVAILIDFNFISLKEYTFFCKYHNDRHVAVGKWLNSHTDEDAVIAAHDIGAIAFYSDRKIIDMAGLITPELIKQINKPLYSDYLNKYLSGRKVDYIVTLRNWFEVVNDNPVFIPINAAEYLEVFKYNPSRTHIQSKAVSFLNNSALQMLQNGRTENAFASLNQSIRLDSHSSRTYFYLGAANEMIKDYSGAEKSFTQAIKLFPEYAEAYYGLARIYFDLNKTEDSRFYLEKCLKIKPDYYPAIQLKNEIISGNP